jgi:hypothetical protein
MRRLGCLTPFGIAAGIIAAAGVLIVALVSGGSMFSPGPLSAQTRTGVMLGGVSSHAALGGDCASCHSSPLDVRGMSGRCLDCHTDIQAQLKSPGSLHNTLPDGAVCLSCHTEHAGPDASLTRIDLPSFPHEKLGFSLQAHQLTVDQRAFVCADCHTALAQTPRPAIAYTFDPAVCVDCHTSYQKRFIASHVADFSAPCLNCHDGVDRYSGFDHNTLAVALEGKHGQATCAICHGPAQSPGSFKGLATTCVGCHQSDDVHLGVYGTDCAGCHTSADWQQVSFDHSRSGFPLTGAHIAATCVSCHTDHIFKGTPNTCVSCHAEPQVHLGQFGTDCTGCHSTSRWEGATFNHTFPLTHGGQGTIPCATCHTNPQQYTVYTCYNCHAHSPADTLAEHRDEGIVADIATCARCHPTGREEGD